MFFGHRSSDAWLSPSGPPSRAGSSCYFAAMPELLAALDAFLQEHRRCGELEAGVEPALVWMAYDCGAELARQLREPSKDK